jgi:protein-S-isoprenylcysteine O-methyltransferase Ste14
VGIINITMRPPRIAAAFTLIAAVSHWTWVLLGGPRFSLDWVGFVSGLVGFMLMMGAGLMFKRQGLAVCPMAPTREVLMQGPYRFSRNPMYLGMVLMLLGIALAMGTPPFYLSTIAFFSLMNRIFCPYEEDKLTAAFGEEYRSYAKQVRRWI